MSKATKFITNFSCCALIWLILSLHNILCPSIKFPVWLDEILPVFPFEVLIAFCAYSMINVGWKLITFVDTPEDYTSLLKEIDTAKEDLRSKGLDI
ncbi:dolichol-phosphate mannosyltransferase subunit 3 [Neocallimastix lanati (nom. inval.)]|jgi:dolichyl-phosphate mannosyltransferase polypeptide 3|uniref:Dolichol-phosphate mannosyltransferase subunit 3 n=1 Tax=Neocallimastix californiae TaxID=1754190 RepID=A0A1Y2FG18_9FUNG|nr:dolichol-phosphate mannosyltransferase subunit 3 [Neocallimastix sp. JGI-2020a]ORY82869.1 dolichol-phosphate mannosyltransferase subunit 3 [Neocallimastix californiae]|eukprot:ORY82869.1 dolichol-phosphate mannosyltransferase subunit 3 [Neocallimastix californiae]